MSSKKSYNSISTQDDDEQLAAKMQHIEDVNDKAADLIDAKFDPFTSNDKARVSVKSGELISEDNIYNEEIITSETTCDHTPIDPMMETFELPRDILTAYILIHLENDGKTNLWSKYNAFGKLGIAFAVLTPFSIQFFVGITLIFTVDWKDADKITDVDGASVWYNIISLSVLFIYMFRDLHGYSTNVWKFIGRVEKQQQIEYNPLHKSRLKNIGTMIFKRWDYHKLDPRQIDINKQKNRCLFIHFRILIICVFVIYAMLTFYSLVQIAVTEGLADKLQVSLSIFFLLEIDDWSYDLFISQNGILEDEMFDVTFVLEIDDKQNKFQRDSRNLWCSLWTVYGSLAFVMIYSFLYNPSF